MFKLNKIIKLLLMFLFVYSCTQPDITNPGETIVNNANTNLSNVTLILNNSNIKDNIVLYSFEATRDSKPVIIPELNVTEIPLTIGYGKLNVVVYAYKSRDLLLGKGSITVDINKPTHTFIVDLSSESLEQKAQAPVYSKEAGTYSLSDSISIELSTSTKAGKVYYTIDGSTPTNKSLEYSNSIQLNTTGTHIIKSKTIAENHIDSVVITKVYTIVNEEVVQPVTFTPAGDVYSIETFPGVTLASAGANIYYTIDGSEPTSSSTEYTDAISLPIGNTVVKAIGYMTGKLQSTVTQATYAIMDSQLPNAKAPVITSSSEAPFTTSTKFSITSATPSATIKYSIDSSVLENVYSEPFALTAGTHTIKAIASKTGFNPSTISELTVVIGGNSNQVDSCVIGYSSATKTVQITSTTNGADIYYTTDNSTPNSSKTKYTSAFSLVAGTYTIKAIAIKSGMTDSSITTKSVTIEEEFDGIIIHVQKPSSWSDMWIWFDKDSDKTWETKVLKTAPGDMENYRDGWYRKKIESTASVTFLFNDGTWANEMKNKGSDFVTTKNVWIALDGTVTYIDPIAPPEPKKPSISVSPAGGKVKGSSVISVTITSDSALTASSATFNGTPVTITGNTFSLTVSNYINDKATGNLVVSATNSVGNTETSYTFNRDDTVIVSNDDIDNLRIFQIMVCSFQDGDKNIGYDWQWNDGQMASGDLQGVINSMDYIVSLGMNAIWMTPIFETFQGQQAHNGYFANDYFKVDQRFGTNELFRTLVNTAHEKGLYIILDGVLGHNAGSNISASPLSGKTPSTSNPVNYNDGGNTLQFYKDVVYYWIKEFKIDGWRFDQSYQLGPGNAGHAGQGAGKFYWDEIRTEIERAVAENKADASNPTFNGKKWGVLGYTVGEDWQGETEIATNTYGTESEKGLHSAFDFPLRYSLVQTLAREEHGKEMSSGRAENLIAGYNSHSKYPSFAHPNLMMGNHDLARFGDLIDNSVANNGFYSERHKAAYSFLATFSGPITVYYGEEWGQKAGNNQLTVMHISRTTGKISGFNTEEQNLINYLKKVMDIRAANSSLWQEGTRTNLVASGDSYADLKYDSDTGNKTVYIQNLGKGSITMTLSASKIGSNSMTDAISNTKLTASGGSYSVQLAPLQAMICVVE